MFKLEVDTNYMEKLLLRWGHGLFLGIKRVSGEILIMNQEGVNIVRSARRIPVEDRWDVKALDWVKFVPWNLCEKDNTADGDIPDGGSEWTSPRLHQRRLVKCQGPTHEEPP